jgi:hypothetical protein
MGLHQLKSICTSKESITRIKRQCTELKKIFASHSFDNELVIDIELKELNTKRTNHPINRWVNESSRRQTTNAGKDIGGKEHL